MRLKNRILNIYYEYFGNSHDNDIKNTRLFALEGMLLTAIIYLANGNFQLYATRLGASDFQLSLVTSLPPLIGMLVLIPGAVIIDKLKTKKNVVRTAPLLFGFLYFLIALVPFFKDNAIMYFLILLPMASIPYHIYTTSWQAYFYDVIPSEKTNYSYTMRTMCTFIVSSTLPLIAGQILSRSLPEKKIAVHQTFLIMCLIAAIAQSIIISRTNSTIMQKKPKMSFDFSDIISVFRNKKFVLFLLPMLLFHMSWHIDWSIHFISQIRYYGANEAWLSYIIVGGNIVQFFFVRFWSNINKKRGVRLTLVFGAAGYTLYALLVIFNLLVPVSFALWFNLFSFLITNVFWVAFTLTAFQALLEVVPKENSTLNISIYNVLILLSNCIMPIIGVKIYTAFGGDKDAMLKTFVLVFIFRIISTFFIFLRWKAGTKD